MILPLPVIENIQGFNVLRDDLLAGGTKRRALVNWLPMLGATSFNYAGTVFGSGGWALAEACRDLGFDCRLYIARSEYRPPWTIKFRDKIIWCDAIPVSMILDVIPSGNGLTLPLGFDDPDFKSCLSSVFSEVEMDVTEIWMACVSGVLVSAAQAAWPDKTVNAVCVARHHGDLGRAVKYSAPEKYHRPAELPPPYPANIFSDAKLWRFARASGLKNALIWNTSS